MHCRVLANSTVVCEPVVYKDDNDWKMHKERLDEMIQQYKEKLEELKVGQGQRRNRLRFVSWLLLWLS